MPDFRLETVEDALRWTADIGDATKAHVAARILRDEVLRLREIIADIDDSSRLSEESADV